MANLQLQKDAKELAELCASVPQDIDGVKQGLLAQDLLEKLKRVEKLSKRVREQSGTHNRYPLMARHPTSYYRDASGSSGPHQKQ